MIAVVVAVTLAGTAQAMSVAEFLGKADALRAKGPMALFSSDIGVLKREGEAATKVWYAQVAPPGRPRNACPPAGPLNIGSNDFLAMLGAVPPQQRASTSVTDAVTSGFNRRFPCR